MWKEAICSGYSSVKKKIILRGWRFVIDEYVSKLGKSKMNCINGEYVVALFGRITDQDQNH